MRAPIGAWYGSDMFWQAKRVEQKLTALTASIDSLKETIMSNLATVIASLNANTNAVATRMDVLLDKITRLGASPEDLASLQAISDHLKQLGADPNNPVPPAFPAGSPDAVAAPAAAVQGPSTTLPATTPVATTDATTAPIVASNTPDSTPSA